MDQSISGDVHRNDAGHFTLTVPEGWRTNDDIVEPKLGIGGLSSSDNEARLVSRCSRKIVQPRSLKRFDAKGDGAFPGYRKLSESKVKVV